MKNCHFFFCGNQLEQVDGVATNSPFCPLLANMFLSHHETKWLKDCPPEFKPSLYRRYVDNCFLLFCSSVHVIPFLNKLNFKHCNIKLTRQIEGKKSFPFLIFKLIVPVIAFLRRFIVNQVLPIYLHLLIRLLHFRITKVQFPHLIVVSISVSCMLFSYQS